jgi:thiol:disulfide interchange protein DsbC
MKKILFLSCLLLVLLLPFRNVVALTKEGAADILKEVIKTEFNVLEVREAPLEGFWEVVTDLGHEKIVIYIHKNLRYVIHGQLMDRQMKKNLTFERLKEFRRVNISSLPLENAIPMGAGKRKIYIFTDPQCYFCFILHEELKRMNDIQAFFFLYPLNHASYEKAKSIWCSQDKVKALEEVYQGKELKSPACDALPIDRNIEFGKHLLIDSTPTLILQSGKIIEGYASTGTLENLLKSSSGL